jgi:hypothetical protein
MRLVADVQPVLFDRRAHLDCLEQLAGRTGEYGDAVGGRLQLDVQEARDPLQILVERVALGRARRVRPAPRRELLAYERLKLIPSGRAGLRVQIETDDRVWRRLEGREPVELFLNGHREPSTVPGPQGVCQT